jgi:hypothetical protein
MARMTKKLMEAYAADDPWKPDHDQAMACRDIEDLLADGILLFRRIGEIEAKYQRLAFASRIEDVEGFVKEIDDFYRAWIEASQRWLMKAERMAAQGYTVEGLNAFRTTIEEAWNLVGNSDLERDIRPLDELIASARPDNPRPGRYRD